jgi:hypothetical protein
VKMAANTQIGNQNGLTKKRLNVIRLELHGPTLTNAF